MKTRLTLIVASSLLVAACASNRSTVAPKEATRANSNGASANALKPKLGYVPDDTTAIAIAVAVWSPIFGKDRIESQKPITANLQNGVWVVQGRPGMGFDGYSTFVALISQDDGRVVEVTAYNE